MSVPVPAAYDLAPIATIALFGALLAFVPVAWVWRRQRGRGAAVRWQALAVLTLSLTFDLVLFGAYTRLTDSGLGCPDWPGCYGQSSPLGAQAQIGDAQQALPEGPVTHHKAWIEMIHRYLATGVGGLILALVVLAWAQARRGRAALASVTAGASAAGGARASGASGASGAAPGSGASGGARGAGGSVGPSSPMPSPWWPTATLAWVCLQGAFGAWTVTLKLYPLIVTLHLLGGLVLLALLAVQTQWPKRATLALPRGLFNGLLALAALSAVQVALGGWVSTNYAVLACSEFPTCQGRWWPAMDFAQGFTLLRGLGVGADGAGLPFAALTAIHVAHRLGAYVVLAGMAAFAGCLWASGDAARRPWAQATAAIAAWQLASGLSNVVLGWPLLGAVAHTGGAAAWVTLLAMLITRARPAP